LFAAPFVLFLFLNKRWKLAAFYSAVYAVSGLFWILYWSFLLQGTGAPMAESANVGIGYFIQRVTEMIHLSPVGLWLMDLNLFRFLAWQSPLVIPLALVGLLAGRGRNATVTCLGLGMVVTFGVALVVLPYQGHGWGYRYLHGCLGSLSLIAAQGWISATEREAATRGNPALALLSSAALSLLVLLPWRAYQVHAFVTPYATAAKAIGTSRAEVVIVDAVDVWFGTDLVRNDPFLLGSPKVMSLIHLEEAKLRELCGRYDVVVFNRNDALRFGLRILPELPEPVAVQNRNLREVMSALNCGRPFDDRP
jgi:hypothetical protein